MQAWPEHSLSVVFTFRFSHSLITHKHSAVPASTFHYGLQHFCYRFCFNRLFFIFFFFYIKIAESFSLNLIAWVELYALVHNLVLCVSCLIFPCISCLIMGMHMHMARA